MSVTSGDSPYVVIHNIEKCSKDVGRFKDFPGVSKTYNKFQDFPSLENVILKFMDFRGLSKICNHHEL